MFSLPLVGKMIGIGLMELLILLGLFLFAMVCFGVVLAVVLFAVKAANKDQ